MRLCSLLNKLASPFAGKRPDDETLQKGVERIYSAASRNPLAKYPFPIGKHFAASLGYEPSLLNSVPQVATEAFVGVSNVGVFAQIPSGSVVVDLGCGSGLDSILAARKTGPSGKVIGVDFSSAMLSRAQKAIEEAELNTIISCENVSADSLSFADSSIDVILINGLFNLTPRRERVFKEIFRVLKETGTIFAAELVFTEPIPQKNITSLDDWFS